VQVRAQSLYSDSLAQPKSARRAWLQAHCDDDAELLSAALAIGESGTRADSAFLGGAVMDRSGERVGRYRLVERIGGGGMGTVYRAERADGAFRQHVAIKLIRPELLSEDGLERFFAERQILAKLEHPGIARLIDGGAEELGIPYVVMELVEGLPIDRYCNDNGLNLNQRLALCARVCEALSAAHEQGIVHRDIKPGNILVNQQGQPKLLDFGIAKVLEADDFGTPLPFTRTGNMAMTPQYASPEQVRGIDVGAASDIYSMGVLFYELLTGNRPYSFSSLSPVEVERTVCDSVPLNPSASVASQRSDVPAGLQPSKQLRRQLRGDLDRVVMTALRKEPSQRYPSVRALAQDLERYGRGEPVQARGASALYRARHFYSRHRPGVWAAGFALVVLVSALIAVSLQAREAERQRDAATAQAARAESAKQFLLDMVGRADPFQNSESATLIDALKQSIDSLGTRFAGQPELEAEMRYAIGYALQNLGEIAPAREQLEQALALRETQGNALEQARALDGLGIVNWWESRFQRSEERFTAALDLIASDPSPEAVELRVGILTNLAGMLAEPGDYERAVAFGQQAITLADDLHKPMPSMLATTYNNVATAQESLGANEPALANFRRSLALRLEVDGELNPDYAITLNNLAFLYDSLGQADEAVSSFARALEIERQILDPQHPEIAIALMNLAWAENRLGQHDVAEKHALEALEILQFRLPPGHLRIGKAHETLAAIYLAIGRSEEAAKQAEDALLIYRSAESVNSDWIEIAQQILDSAKQSEE